MWALLFVVGVILCAIIIITFKALISIFSLIKKHNMKAPRNEFE